MAEQNSTPTPKGFSRQNVLDLEKNLITDQPPMQVQAATPTADGKFKITSTQLNPDDIDYSKIESKDFHKLIGTGLFNAIPLALPESLNIKLKDPNYIIVGVNRLAEGGSRIAMFKAAGHQFITKSELQEPIPFDIATDDPQGVTFRDLCFMKVLKRRHLENMEAIHQATQAQSGKDNIQRAMASKAAEVVGTETAGKYGDVFFVPMLDQNGKMQGTSFKGE